MMERQTPKPPAGPNLSAWQILATIICFGLIFGSFMRADSSAFPDFAVSIVFMILAGSIIIGSSISSAARVHAHEQSLYRQWDAYFKQHPPEPRKPSPPDPPRLTRSERKQRKIEQLSRQVTHYPSETSPDEASPARPDSTRPAASGIRRNA
jgi:hypothetical protein